MRFHPGDPHNCDKPKPSSLMMAAQLLPQHDTGSILPGMEQPWAGLCTQCLVGPGRWKTQG